jgi:hypothetical protein
VLDVGKHLGDVDLQAVLGSVLPARLRTTIKPGVSSMTVGGVIQFSGLYPPASACTSTDPSALTMISRSACGSSAERRPE